MFFFFTKKKKNEKEVGEPSLDRLCGLFIFNEDELVKTSRGTKEFSPLTDKNSFEISAIFTNSSWVL